MSELHSFPPADAFPEMGMPYAPILGDHKYIVELVLDGDYSFVDNASFKSLGSDNYKTTKTWAADLNLAITTIDLPLRGKKLVACDTKPIVAARFLTKEGYIQLAATGKRSFTILIYRVLKQGDFLVIWCERETFYIKKRNKVVDKELKALTEVDAEVARLRRLINNAEMKLSKMIEVRDALYRH